MHVEQKPRFETLSVLGRGGHRFSHWVDRNAKLYTLLLLVAVLGLIATLVGIVFRLKA
jgi:hypothetical protein